VRCCRGVALPQDALLAMSGASVKGGNQEREGPQEGSLKCYIPQCGTRSSLHADGAAAGEPNAAAARPGGTSDSTAGGSEAGWRCVLSNAVARVVDS
jgi:hypothetical protein